MRVLRPVHKPFSRGQTIMEAVMVIVILGILLTALISVTAAATKNNIAAQNRTLAVSYAQSYLEQARSSRDKSGWNDFTCPSAPDFSYDTIRFTTLTLTCAGDAIDNRRRITAVVQWSEAGKTKNVEISDYFTRWQ